MNAPAEVAAVEHDPRRCLDCGSALTGPHCSQCGQQDRDPDPTFRELVAEAWDAFASVDGRLLGSLRLLLLQPGALTVACLRGQRTRYMAPLRLYLFCSVAYFLVSTAVDPDRSPNVSATFGDAGDTLRLSARRASAPEDAGQVARRDSASRVLLAQHGITAPGNMPYSTRQALADSVRWQQQLDTLPRGPQWLRARLEHGVHRAARDNYSIAGEYAALIPRLMFALMPVFALLLALAYRSRRRRYPVHLVVALHLHAFAFALFTLDEARVLVQWTPLSAILKGGVYLWFLAYIPLALRRVYGGRLRYAMLRAALLGSEYLLIGAVAYSLLAVVLLLRY